MMGYWDFQILVKVNECQRILTYWFILIIAFLGNLDSIKINHMKFISIKIYNIKF